MKEINSIKEIKEQFEELKSKMSKDGKSLLSKAFKEFFKENPKIESLQWTQYTPYFNDGDVCEFSVNEMQFKFISQTAYSDYDDDGYISEYSDVDFTLLKECGDADRLGITEEDFDNYCAIVDKFQEQINLPDDIMKTVFGEHSKVTATRSGFDVEEYEHD